MNASADLRDVLNVVSRIFLWCFAMGFLLLLFWLACVFVAGDWAYRIHAGMFDLSEHDFDMMNYYGLACTKVCVFLFFLIPYIAIRLVMRRM